jgi:hypothetical protein
VPDGLGRVHQNETQTKRQKALTNQRGCVEPVNHPDGCRLGVRLTRSPNHKPGWLAAWRGLAGPSPTDAARTRLFNRRVIHTSRTWRSESVTPRPWGVPPGRVSGSGFTNQNQIRLIQRIWKSARPADRIRSAPHRRRGADRPASGHRSCGSHASRWCGLDRRSTRRSPRG